MALMRFRAGTEVSIDGKPYRFADFVDLGEPDKPPCWFLCRLDVVKTELFSVAALRKMFDEGQLRRLYTAADGRAIDIEVTRRRRTYVPDDLPPADRRRRDLRAEFVSRVQARVGCRGAHARLGPDISGKPDTLLSRALAEVSREMAAELKGVGLWDRRKRSRTNLEAAAQAPTPPAGKPGDDDPDAPVYLVDQATYYRWRVRYDPEDKRGLEGDFAARGNRNQLLPAVRETMQTVMRDAIIQAKDKRQVGKVVTVTMAGLRSAIDEALAPERLRTPELRERLVPPSTPTLHRHWRKFSAFDRACAMKGQTRARQEFRFIRGHEHPEAPYELVEYDETKMPFMFVDEIHGVALGRGNLCAALCVATHSIGGFTVSFEPFGDMTMMSTLRHAVSLKSYVAHEYGGRIRNEYLPGGMFQCIAIDNSRQAWGKTLKQAARTLDCDRMWLPPRTPWFKPVVEGFFHTLNQLLLREMPGFTLGRAIDSNDYDPKVNACIGLRQFLFLFHAWVCDVYQVRRQEGLENRSPNECWRELLANGEPGLLDSSDDMDSLFGVVRQGTLDHRGVRFHNIRYGGDELRGLRLDGGAKQNILFKVNPSNLLHVRVKHPGLKDWVRGEAYRRDYANGLSLYVHDLVQKQIRRRGLDEKDEYTQALGLADLKALIAESLPQVVALGSGPAIARALSINSTHLIGSIDRLGHLTTPTGPWEGQTLSPFPAAALPSPDTNSMSSADQRSPTPSNAGPSPILQTPAAAPGEPPQPRSVRPRRTFIADDSIAHVRLTHDPR